MFVNLKYFKLTDRAPRFISEESYLIFIWLDIWGMINLSSAGATLRPGRR